MDNNELLELDYSYKKKSKRFLIAFIAYISLPILFNVFSSYKNPTIRINNKLENYYSYHFKNNLETEIRFIARNISDNSSSILDSTLKAELIGFYQYRDFNPIWIENFGFSRNFSTLLNLLDSSAYFGFPFDYFNVQRLQELRNEIQYAAGDLQQNQVELELTATYSAMKFILYLKNGIVERDISYNYTKEIEALPELLSSAIESNEFRNEILATQPNLVHHRNLLKSLSYYIDLHYSIKYTTPAFIDDKLLAKSLYYAEITESPFFDSSNLKVDALFGLQDQYGLRHDSVLNVPTHEKLVSLLEYKYFLACLNLNRLRNLKHSGENYLFVNIPEYKLHVVESNKAKETFNVIVGKKKTPTPVFTSNIEKVIANPYWTVPRSITFEMLHKIRKDPTYLKRKGYFVINWREEIVDESIIDWNSNDPLGKRYWLRQINNRHNALGQVKFIFPNNYSVYLHDTPSKKLFNHENRTFSHGCVRLENPDKLAQYITDKYSGKEDKNIENLISEKERHEIALSEKVKIHIQYITCTVSENSEIMFLDDIYNKDTEEIKAIFPDLLEI